MQSLVFTGPSGPTALAAAATAAAAAAAGVRVLLVSVGPSHPSAALFNLPPVAEPQKLSEGLDLWCLDPLSDLSLVWDAIKPSSGPTIVGEEIPVIPGSDLFLAVTRLRKLEGRYDLACVDAGPPEALLRALGAPDTFRWLVRLFIGLDRGPGRSSASVSRAMIPTGLLPIPMEWTGRVQEARIALERLRDEMTATSMAQVRYVFTPDRPGLADARINVPALQLFGLAIECLIAGPMLPRGISGIEALANEQVAVQQEAGAIWHGHAIYGLAATANPGSVESLARIGALLYDEDSPLPGPPPPAPILITGPPDPAVSLDLPGLPREALGLTLSGDELIVRAGPYRRHLLLPEGLRGMTAIKASRQGEKLIIRSRSA
ncbi:MAG: ArsA-related P-loop ATPase [Oscillochloridaceae bacterium umkhey_bin13]